MAFKKLFFVITFSLFLPFFSFAQSVDQSALIQQLQKQVEELTKKIQALQQQLGAVQSELGAQPEVEPVSEPTQESIPDFTRTLSRGISGDDVRKLQEFLKKDREIYPDGLITGYFGPKTEEALKRWQKKHNIEQAGILGPQTRARFQELGKGRIKELITEGAGISNIIPPGLLTAPGIQRKVELTATTTITTTTPKIPPRPDSCATSNNYCINSDECSKGGFYWCRNSCYATSTACLGETFVAPAQPAVSPTPTPTPTPTQTTTTQTTQTQTTQTITATATADNGLSTPSNLTGSVSSTTNLLSPLVTLNWTVATQPINEFKIFRRISGGSWVQALGGIPNVNSASEQVSFGTYDYKVQACNATNCSPDSNIITVVVSGPNDTQPPSIPSGLTVTASSPWQINISWSDSGDNVYVDGYKIYRNGVFLKNTTRNSVYDNTVSPVTYYSYTISAYDAAGNVSAQSNPVSITTATTTSSVNFDTASRLAQILESLNNILNSLKLIR